MWFPKLHSKATCFTIAKIQKNGICLKLNVVSFKVWQFYCKLCTLSYLFLPPI